MNKQAIEQLNFAHLYLTNADLANRDLLEHNTEYYHDTPKDFYKPIFENIMESLYYIEGVLTDTTRANKDVSEIIYKRIYETIEKLKQYYGMFVIIQAFQSTDAKSYLFKLYEMETNLRKAIVSFQLYRHLINEYGNPTTETNQKEL